MSTDYDDHYLQELRSSGELASCFIRERWETDDGSHALATLHFRGGQAEFDLGCRYLKSVVADEREAGACILSQLGRGKKTFHEESVALLISLLDDPVVDVVQSAAIALGHRNDSRAIEPLLSLIYHPDAGIRYGVVAGLSQHDNPDAIAGLIQLSSDPDDATRDWATFGLGTQTDVDTPALREALVARLADSDPEIRGEAMIGLARRGDQRACPAIDQELRGEFHGDWAIAAAELLAKREWLPLLQAQRGTLAPEDRDSFGGAFDAAISACQRKRVEESPRSS